MLAVSRRVNKKTPPLYKSTQLKKYESTAGKGQFYEGLGGGTVALTINRK